MEKYRTERLQCLDKARELRKDYAHRIWNARSEGKVVGACSGSRTNVIMAALEGCQPAEWTGWGLPFIGNKEWALKCQEAHESAGYLGDYCGFHRVQFGAMLLNKNPWWGEGRFRPDFMLPISYCEPLAKSFRQMADHFGIPCLPLDLPCVHTFDLKERESFREYFLAQLMDAVEWMQRVTGRGYNDEKLIEGVRNEMQNVSYSTRIAELVKTVPSPLNLRMYFSLFSPVNFLRHEQRCVEYFRMAHDEIRHHTENKIAALATERYRIVHEGIHILFAPHLYEVFKKYGAVDLPGTFVLGLGSEYDRQTDGSWAIRKSWEERGLPLKTREDALRWIAEWYINNIHFSSMGLSIRFADIKWVAKEWHANAFAFHFDRGCVGLSAGMPEHKAELKQMGIPSFIYEADAYDPRKVSEPEMTRLFETFLESQGLTRLED